MQAVKIGGNQAGQRFDKFLFKYLPEAHGSFLYKMLRKKNIVLNGKKAEGKEILRPGDEVKFFFSDETIERFGGGGSGLAAVSENKTAPESYMEAFRLLMGIKISYEDNHILILNKPAGILTQKAAPDDMSLNEWMIGYVMSREDYQPQEHMAFKPSVCNRLDRNTSGLVLCGKTLAGTQILSEIIRERRVRKFYRTIVTGNLTEPLKLEGHLKKNPKTNKSHIQRHPVRGGDSYIQTYCQPLHNSDDLTYLEVELITGKPHQIRSHLSSIGHPVAGDGKYGNEEWNARLRKQYGLKHQLLHAYRLEFPELTGTLSQLSGLVVTAPLPEYFIRILSEHLPAKDGI